MRDDFLTADWAQGHGRLTETIAGFLAALVASFEKLHRHQFDAPWRHDVTRPERTLPCATTAGTNR